MVDLPIYWSTFSWEACATLATGLAAVFAAWRVGHRQIALLSEQQKFAIQQAEQARVLKLQELKISLLDRRIECISKMREIEYDYLRHNDIKAERLPDLNFLISTCALIFPPEIADELDQILIGSLAAKSFFERSRDYHSRGNNEKGSEYLELGFAQEDIVMNLLPKMTDRLTGYTRINDWD